MSELRPGLAAVRDLARSAQGVQEAGELLDRICVSVAETFGFGRTGISRFHPESARLELLAAHGISADEVRQLSSSLDDWQIFKRALETRDLVFIEDVSAEHGLPPGVAEAYGARGVLVLPLLSQQRCIGFLTADHGGEPFELDSRAAELMRTIGALVASFLESALAR
jgi:GAF domain-containing protein